jgi:hypothetical protein
VCKSRSAAERESLNRLLPAELPFVHGLDQPRVCS